MKWEEKKEKIQAKLMTKDLYATQETKEKPLRSHVLPKLHFSLQLPHFVWPTYSSPAKYYWM